MKRWLSKVFITHALLLTSFNSMAFSVSDIIIMSKLGEPLKAKVAIKHEEELTAEGLRIQLASKDIYKQLQVERSYLSQQIQFKLQDNNEVMLSTPNNIKEPYLHFILQFRWPEGELNREYKVFLDP